MSYHISWVRGSDHCRLQVARPMTIQDLCADAGIEVRILYEANPELTGDYVMDGETLYVPMASWLEAWVTDDERNGDESADVTTEEPQEHTEGEPDEEGAGESPHDDAEAEPAFAGGDTGTDSNASRDLDDPAAAEDVPGADTDGLSIDGNKQSAHEGVPASALILSLDAVDLAAENDDKDDPAGCDDEKAQQDAESVNQDDGADTEPEHEHDSTLDDATETDAGGAEHTVNDDDVAAEQPEDTVPEQAIEQVPEQPMRAAPAAVADTVKTTPDRTKQVETWRPFPKSLL